MSRITFSEPLVAAWTYVQLAHEQLLARSVWTRMRFLYRQMKWLDVWTCGTCNREFYWHFWRRPPMPRGASIKHATAMWRPSCGLCNTMTPASPTPNFVDLVLEE